MEVYFCKYAFVAHDLFVKHLCFYVSDIIAVGIDVLPMKQLEKDMIEPSQYYERDLNQRLEAATWCRILGRSSWLAAYHVSSNLSVRYAAASP